MEIIDNEGNNLAGTSDTSTKQPQSKSNNFVRKGISSVEEEIHPHISRIGCGGISTVNNDLHSSVVFGMCKFHASGREDMDVRMLLW
jgi:tRNA U54 and U55 pseudouridine synthase Pus10